MSKELRNETLDSRPCAWRLLTKHTHGAIEKIPSRRRGPENFGALVVVEKLQRTSVVLSLPPRLIHPQSSSTTMARLKKRGESGAAKNFITRNKGEQDIRPRLISYCQILTTILAPSQQSTSSKSHLPTSDVFAFSRESTHSNRVIPNEPTKAPLNQLHSTTQKTSSTSLMSPFFNLFVTTKPSPRSSQEQSADVNGPLLRTSTMQSHDTLSITSSSNDILPLMKR